MFDIDKSKAINSMLFVLNQLGAEKSDAHKVFKILYFADQKHLVTYGRPIKEGLINKTNKHFLTTSYQYDEEDLSESEIECLNEAIAENKDISFKKLTEKSHDSAWQNAQWHIDYLAMAKAVTNNPDILNYIKINALNEQMCF